MSEQSTQERRRQPLDAPPDQPPVAGSASPYSDGPLEEQYPPEPSKPGRSGHRWMMLACCVPMLVLVGVLLVTGVAGTGVIVFGALCVAMMGLMMFAMPGGHGH